MAPIFEWLVLKALLAKWMWPEVMGDGRKHYAEA